MDKKCEVVGWVLLDDSASLLVLDDEGRVALEGCDPQGIFSQEAIQTGSFRRQAIVDPVTKEMLGYDLERVPSPLLKSA